MRSFGGVGVVLLFAACSTDPVADISGTWAWTETINASTGFVCQATGELLLAQFRNNNRFTGQRSRMGTCQNAPDGFSIDGAQNITNAEVVGSRVTFEVDFCQYQGTLSGSSQMSGTFVCPDGLGQLQIMFDGTWSATRS